MSPTRLRVDENVGGHNESRKPATTKSARQFSSNGSSPRNDIATRTQVIPIGFLDRYLCVERPRGCAVGLDATRLVHVLRFKDSFMYLTNQYFSGGRMLQSGDRLGQFHNIFAAPARLARLLHCVSESVACQISASAVGDSRSSTRILPGAWNLGSLSYVIAEP
jgi:hypothetical protein